MNIRKICFIILSIWMLSIIKLSAQDSVQYKIKYGTLTYTMSSILSLPGMPPLKITAEGESSFDDYGKKQVTHYTEKNNPGEAILCTTKHYLTLRLPGYWTLINEDTNEKIDEENLSSATKETVAQHSITDYDHLTGTAGEMFTSELIGSTTYLGKVCKKYRVTEKMNLYGSEEFVTVWNNIVLERKVKTAAFQYEYKVVKINEAEPDASLFSIPEINQ